MRLLSPESELFVDLLILSMILDLGDVFCNRMALQIRSTLFFNLVMDLFVLLHILLDCSLIMSMFLTSFSTMLSIKICLC